MWVYNCAEIELPFKSLWDSIKDSLISEYLPSGLFSSSWEMAISWSLQVYFNLPLAVTPVPQTILWALMSFPILMVLHRQKWMKFRHHVLLEVSHGPQSSFYSSSISSSQCNQCCKSKLCFRTCPNKRCLEKILLIDKIFSFTTRQPANQLVTWANCALAAHCMQ